MAAQFACALQPLAGEVRQEYADRVRADPEQVGEMTSVLVRGLTEAGLREQLRANGFARAREFPPCHTSGRVLDLLEQVAGQAA